MTRKYIYGVIPTGEQISFGCLGPGDGVELGTVPYQNLACVVSDYSGGTFSALAKEELVRHLLAHQSVCEHVMKQHTVLPMRLGTLLEADEEVLAMLQQGYARFSNALARIEGKVEFEVAATWDLGRVFQEVGCESDIVNLKQAIGDRPKDEALEDRVLLGKMVKDSMDRRRDDYRQRMVDFLKDLALDIQENALLRDELVMNVAVLIRRARERDLTRHVQGLDELFHDEINFRIIGPLPPYSFSTVEVAEPNARKMENARELLGLETQVCEGDVRQAYRKLVAASHPDVNPHDPGAEEKVNRLHEASTLLTEYCRAQSNGDRGADKERVSLSPETVAKTFAISIKRTAAQIG